MKEETKKFEDLISLLDKLILVYLQNNVIVVLLFGAKKIQKVKIQRMQGKKRKNNPFIKLGST